MAKKVGSIILVVIASLAIVIVLRVVYVAVKCGTITSGNGIAMKVLWSGKCEDNTSQGGSKKKNKQKKRRNKKY